MGLKSDATLLAHENEVRGLKANVEHFRRMLAEAQRQLAESDERLNTALALDADVHRKIPAIRPPSRKTSCSAAVVLASDWHSEEEVRPETVNGRNKYTLAIAKKRIERFFENIVYLIDLQRKGTHIDTLILAMLGDFMTGYIHEEFEENNQLSPVETILWLFGEISAGLAYLEAEAKLENIEIPCCVGNHGRTTRKPRSSTRCKNSYEWMMYHFLAQRFPQFNWHIATGYHVYMEVYGMNLRLHHGDNIRYQGGVGGITIPVNKAIAAWDKSIRADLDLFGHWHQYLASRKFVCNGCLIGYNAFALDIKADFEPPSQTFFLIEKDHGRTITSPIFLS